MRIDGKTLPNNPMKAYQQGKLMGTKQNMDLVSEVLLTKLDSTCWRKRRTATTL